MRGLEHLSTRSLLDLIDSLGDENTKALSDITRQYLPPELELGELTDKIFPKGRVTFSMEREGVNEMQVADVVWNIKCPDCGKGMCINKEGEYFCDARIEVEVPEEPQASGDLADGPVMVKEMQDCPARGIRFKVNGMDSSARLYLELVKEEKKT